MLRLEFLATSGILEHSVTEKRTKDQFLRATFIVPKR